jgi:hypothetical protein
MTQVAHPLTEVTRAQGQAWIKALGVPAGGYPVLTWREDDGWRVWPPLTDGALMREGRRPVAWRGGR